MGGIVHLCNNQRESEWVGKKPFRELWDKRLSDTITSAINNARTAARLLTIDKSGGGSGGEIIFWQRWAPPPFWQICSSAEQSQSDLYFTTDIKYVFCHFTYCSLLAPQSGAFRRGSHRDFYPIPSTKVDHGRPRQSQVQPGTVRYSQVQPFQAL